MPHRLATMPLLLAVAACANAPTVDDPKNAPKLGEWRMGTRISKVEIDGRTLSQIEMSEALGGYENIAPPAEKLGCTEPRVRDAEAFNAALPPKLANMCKITEVTDDFGSIAFKTQCSTDSLPDQVSDVGLVGDGRVSADKVDLQFRARIEEKTGGGGKATTRMTKDVFYWRTGDCA